MNNLNNLNLFLETSRQECRTRDRTDSGRRDDVRSQERDKYYDVAPQPGGQV